MGNLEQFKLLPTVQAIFKLWAGKTEEPRQHLGASVIGRPCERQLWYSFRWCYEEFTIDSPEDEVNRGRMLRLFERGKAEEHAFARDLRAIGIELHTIDSRTGKPPRMEIWGGHIGGSTDAIGRGFPESPKVWHVVEEKTHNAKSFGVLLTKGVYEAKFEHWTQMQLYMRWFDLDRAIYLAVNKDTDELYGERIKEDKKAAEAAEQKAIRIVSAPRPLPRLSENPAWFQCKFCAALDVCHGKKVPATPINCRTCAHSTPLPDRKTEQDEPRWHCGRHKRDVTYKEQQRGCDAHRFIPELIPYAKAVDADENENWIEYEFADGKRIRNGAPGPNSYLSREFVGVDPAAFSDPEVAALRAEFDASITGYVKGKQE